MALLVTIIGSKTKKNLVVSLQADATVHSIHWCHGSTAVALLAVMFDDPGSNLWVNHGCMYICLAVTPNEHVKYQVIK
jgi:hypothetical protein